MDSITHITTGALIGELMLGKRIGKKAMLWGALAANAPDLDSVLYLFTDDVDSLLLHRGFSHSILAAVMFSPLIGRVLHSWMPSVGWRRWTLFLFLQIMIHNALDTATIYGTGLLVPFSDHRFSWDNIFVLDPIFTLPLLIVFMVLLISPAHLGNRQKWASAGLVLSMIYMMMTFFNKSVVESVFRSSLEQSGITYKQHFTAPVILNNFLWHGVATVDSGHYVAHYSLFDKERNAELHFVPINEDLLGKFQNDRKVEKLKRFSQGFYCITQTDEGVWFNDMRFGQVKGWEDAQGMYAFSFNLSQDADNSTVVQKGRIEGSKREALRSLWKRIRGI